MLLSFSKSFREHMETVLASFFKGNEGFSIIFYRKHKEGFSTSFREHTKTVLASFLKEARRF